MDINGLTDVLEMDVLVAEEDMPNIIDTSLLMYLVPYKCGYSNPEDIRADGKTPIWKKVKIYISVIDVSKLN